MYVVIYIGIHKKEYKDLVLIDKQYTKTELKFASKNCIWLYLNHTDKKEAKILYSLVNNMLKPKFKIDLFFVYVVKLRSKIKIDQFFLSIISLHCSTYNNVNKSSLWDDLFTKE